MMITKQNYSRAHFDRFPTETENAKRKTEVQAPVREVETADIPAVFRMGSRNV